MPASPSAAVVLGWIVAWPLACGVPAPGGAGAGVLAGGGGVVEAEGAGDDGGGDLQDELAQRGDAGGAQRQAVVAELGGDGAVGGGLAAWRPGNSQSLAWLAGTWSWRAAASWCSSASNGAGTGLGGSPSRSQVCPASSRERSPADSRRMRLSGWA